MALDKPLDELNEADLAALIKAGTPGLRTSEYKQTSLRSDPEIAERFVSHLLFRNKRMHEDLVDHLFHRSEKRLARLLLLLAHYGKNGKSEPAIPKISQETLAEMVGTTRGRVSFFMNRFRKLGHIEYNGGCFNRKICLAPIIALLSVGRDGFR